MPTYAYVCTACDHAFEAVQAITDDALTDCPSCGGSLRKKFHPVGVTFKGSGFYRTDSRAGSSGSTPVDCDQRRRDACEVGLVQRHLEVGLLRLQRFLVRLEVGLLGWRSLVELQHRGCRQLLNLWTAAHGGSVGPTVTRHGHPVHRRDPSLARPPSSPPRSGRAPSPLSCWGCPR